MDLPKKKNSYYLFVKLNAIDWQYLKGFRKYEPPKHVKNTEKYLSKVVSLYIKAIFVMTSALMLEADKKITRKKSKSVFIDLDKALVGFAKIVDKYFIDLGKK